MGELLSRVGLGSGVVSSAFLFVELPLIHHLAWGKMHKIHASVGSSFK